MCGLTGLSYKKGLTAEQKRTAMQKLKVIAFFNDTRGGDGVGMFLNDEVIKAETEVKTFRHFVDSEYKGVLPLPGNDGGTVLIHTRKATQGMQKKENNHPFYIKGEEEKDDIVFCHNGENLAA